MSGFIHKVIGFCPWCGLHVSAQVASLPTPGTPLRSSVSAPPRLPRRSMQGHPLCQAPSRSTVYTCSLQRDQQLSQLLAVLLTWAPPALPVRPTKTLTGRGAQPPLPAPCQGSSTRSKGSRTRSVPGAACMLGRNGNALTSS